MRSLLAAPLAFTLLALASSCTVESKDIYMDVRWWTVCPTPQWSGCNAFDKHDIQAHSGDVVGSESFGATCRATQSNGQLAVSFSVRHNDDILDVRGIVTQRNGGPVLGGGCSVAVTEEENTHVGACGPDAPSAEQPCQINDVVIDRNDADGKSVTVRMRCVNLPSDTNPSRTYNIADTANVFSPAAIRLANCRGL
jgi:hypothetical protein